MRRGVTGNTTYLGRAVVPSENPVSGSVQRSGRQKVSSNVTQGWGRSGRLAPVGWRTPKQKIGDQLVLKP